MRLVSTWAGKALPLAGGTMTGDITMSGANIELGANKLKTTTLYLYEQSVSALGIKAIADDAQQDLYVRNLSPFGSIKVQASAQGIAAHNLNAAHAHFTARDTGVGPVEVARQQGAADPYFQATLPMVLKPSAYPATLVEGHFGYIADEDRLVFWDGSNSRRVTDNILVASGDLTAGAQHAKIFSWKNDLVGGSILVFLVVIDITTPSAAAALLNVGQAATEVESDNLMDGVGLSVAAVLNSLAEVAKPACKGVVKVADDEYITGFEDDTAASTDLVGKYYIFYRVI